MNRENKKKRNYKISDVDTLRTIVYQLQIDNDSRLRKLEAGIDNLNRAVGNLLIDGVDEGKWNAELGEVEYSGGQRELVDDSEEVEEKLTDDEKRFLIYVLKNGDFNYDLQDSHHIESILSKIDRSI